MIIKYLWLNDGILKPNLHQEEHKLTSLKSGTQDFGQQILNKAFTTKELSVSVKDLFVEFVFWIIKVLWFSEIKRQPGHIFVKSVFHIYFCPLLLLWLVSWLTQWKIKYLGKAGATVRRRYMKAEDSCINALCQLIWIPYNISIVVLKEQLLWVQPNSTSSLPPKSALRVSQSSGNRFGGSVRRTRGERRAGFDAVMEGFPCMR